MTSATTMELIAVRKYESFEDIKTLVDVGGGVGKDLETIISSYPHIHGINYDLPHVIADAPTMPGIQDFFHANLVLCILQQSNVLYGICNMSHLWDLQMHYGMVNPLPIILGKLLGELIREN